MEIKRKLFTSITLSIIIITLVLISGFNMGAIAKHNDSSRFTPSARTIENSAGSFQFVLMSSTPNLSTAVISAVQSGTPSTSTVTLNPSPNPIGTNVSIDIRIDNVSVGFWGYAVPTVTWNPAVVNLVKAQQGPFLANNTGGDSTEFVGDSSKTWNNTGGILGGGLAAAIFGLDTSTDASGVLATLTFQVTGYGNSTIAIAGGYLIPSSNDNSNVTVACNDATIVVLSNSASPTPTPTSNSTPTPTTTPTAAPTPTTSENAQTTSTPQSPTPTPKHSPSTTPTSTPKQSDSPSPTATVPEFPLGVSHPNNHNRNHNHHSASVSLEEKK